MRACLLLGLLTQLGCVGAPGTATGGTRPDDGRGVVGGPAAVRAKEKAVVDASATPTEPSAEFPLPTDLYQDPSKPGVLMPCQSPADLQVMRIHGQPIHKSHVYDRLFEANARVVKDVVDSMVFDILLAQQAVKFKISLDMAMIDTVVAEEEARLADQVQRDWQGRMSVDTYLQIKRGLDRKSHREFMRRRMARDLFRYYVVRYLALREDRVQVRILTHPDKAEIETIRSMVLEGADFQSLALKKSRHPSQKAGGKLLPFGHQDRSDYTEAAFALRQGEVSQVRQTTQGGAPMYYLLYCLRHLPGRDISFAAAKPELDKAWSTNPLSRGEGMALYRRLRDVSESLNNGGQKR